jgi:phospholipid/cholesterol/gamma-HCH transport system permease protein
MNTILNMVAAIGRGAIASCRSAGALAIFAVEGLIHIFLPPYYPRLFGRAIFGMGFLSLPVVALTAIFAGMVVALQSYTGFARYAAQSQTATIVALAVTRELGPVLAALMMAGRAGAAMAAELGTMRVTDQIDALQTLSTKPMKYLVAPRLLAGIIAMPLLVIVADILGVLGGYIVCTVKLDFNGLSYIQDSVTALHADDVALGLSKGVVFGFVIALSGCFHGYRSRGGAEGVGSATTSAVVMASVLVLALDYVMTEVFFTR